MIVVRGIEALSETVACNDLRLVGCARDVVNGGLVLGTSLVLMLRVLRLTADATARTVQQITHSPNLGIISGARP